MAERSAAILEKLRAHLRGTVRADVPMADHTTWRIGGPAQILIEPVDVDDLRLCLDLLGQAGLPWVVMGSGSNLLVRDGGIAGAVIGMRLIQELHFGKDAEVVAGGGLPLMSLIQSCCDKGLAGLEDLSGIPGTVGGAVFMNAGAGGREIADVVRSVTLLSEEGEKTLEAGELDFGYRRSGLGANEIVTSTRLQLWRANPDDLNRVIREKLKQRRSTQGVGGPNAGSVFKNPPGESAWKLIDRVGLRGRKIGGAMVSQRHANFIVNTGKASAADVLALIELVRREVAEKCGVVLEPEVRILGIDGARKQSGLEMETE